MCVNKRPKTESVILAFVMASLAQSVQASEESVVDLMESGHPEARHLPSNLVIEPAYENPTSEIEEKDRTEANPEKLQYEPVDDDLPILENRRGMAEEKSGSRYEEGTELHITPGPDILLKDEKIEEKTAKPVDSLPVPKGGS